MKMGNETYDKVKWVVMIFMPAFTTLVAGLGEVYNWEFTTIATATLTLVTTFMGAITIKSSSDYKKEE